MPGRFVDPYFHRRSHRQRTAHRIRRRNCLVSGSRLIPLVWEDASTRLAFSKDEWNMKRDSRALASTTPLFAVWRFDKWKLQGASEWAREVQSSRNNRAMRSGVLYSFLFRIISICLWLPGITTYLHFSLFRVNRVFSFAGFAYLNQDKWD